jgi:hypothetical protein
MRSADSELPNVTAQGIEEALGRLGEPIMEAQAKAVRALEDCECKEGMFALAASRRQLFAGTGLVAAVGMTTMLPRAADAKAPVRLSTETGSSLGARRRRGRGQSPRAAHLRSAAARRRSGAGAGWDHVRLGHAAAMRLSARSIAHVTAFFSGVPGYYAPNHAMSFSRLSTSRNVCGSGPALCQI